MSIRDDAINYVRELKENEEKEKRRKFLEKLGRERVVASTIRSRFCTQIFKMPVLLEVLCDFYNPDCTWLSRPKILEGLLKKAEGPKIFDSIGTDTYDLMQEKFEYFEDERIVEWNAWAIKFAGVFGCNFYLIPYVDRAQFGTRHDFAVRVISERKNYFFPNDPDKISMWRLIAEYLDRESTIQPAK